MNRRADDKPSNPANPKDRVAGTKLPCGLAPDTASIGLSLAFLEGALKYGRYNWRIAGVSASVYNDALERHRKKWWNGQSADPITKVLHLQNLMACAAILLDAELYGMLNDDRPPCPDPDAMARYIDETSAVVVHLKELFKDHNPKQYRLGDLPPGTERLVAPEETFDDFLQEFEAPSDPAKLPRIADGKPWGAPWAITDCNGALLSTHSSYADAEAVLRDMLAPPPVNTPEELAELEKMGGRVVLVAGPGIVDGGEGRHVDGELVIVPPEFRPDHTTSDETHKANLAEHGFPLFKDCPSERGNLVDEAGLERCGHMSNTKRVCTRMGAHAGAHADDVVLWSGIE